MNFLPADIILVNSIGLIDRLIGHYQQSPGESKTIAKHVAGVVEEGSMYKAQIVEATATGVKERPLSIYASRMDASAAIYRCTSLTRDQRNKIVAAAREFVGRPYGFFTLVGNMMDYYAGGYKYRRMLGSRKVPICSKIWGVAYATVGINFLNRQPDDVQPDDIADSIMDLNNPAWECVGTL